MPVRQGTRAPRQNKAEQEAQERANTEAQLMLEIRENMANIREGINLENILTTVIEKLPEVMSLQYRQILTIALGNVRKLNTNFLYREHSILAQLIPEAEIEDDVNENDDEDENEDDIDEE